MTDMVTPDENNERSALTPAQAVARWREQRAVSGYGDPAIAAPELARMLRHEAENRRSVRNASDDEKTDGL